MLSYPIILFAKWKCPLPYFHPNTTGAFFIPYVLALFFIGIPILVLEIALGQLYQTGGE